MTSYLFNADDSVKFRAKERTIFANDCLDYRVTNYTPSVLKSEDLQVDDILYLENSLKPCVYLGQSSHAPRKFITAVYTTNPDFINIIKLRSPFFFKGKFLRDKVVHYAVAEGGTIELKFLRAGAYEIPDTFERVVPAYNWSQAKAGDAFQMIGSNSNVYYVCPVFGTPDEVYIRYELYESCGTFSAPRISIYRVLKKNLIPQPTRNLKLER